MTINRESLVADFKISFGNKAEVIYANLRDDYTAQLPNTSLFSKRSTHQAIIALIESATKHNKNEKLAKYWNQVYQEFIKRNPNKQGLESVALDDREAVFSMTDEEAEAFNAEAKRVQDARDAKSAASQEAYAAKAAAMLAGMDGDEEKDDIPF